MTPDYETIIAIAATVFFLYLFPFKLRVGAKAWGDLFGCKNLKDFKNWLFK